MRRLVMSVAWLAASCAHSSNADYGKAAEAIIALATAASVATLNVASGACVTACGYGTYCDEHGMCKAFPCHDSCNANEECVLQPVEHCVQRAAVREQRVEVQMVSDGAHLYTPAPPPPPLLPDSHPLPDSSEQR